MEQALTSHLQDLVALGERYLADGLLRYRDCEPGEGGMSGPQGRFAGAQERYRLFRAANDAGKSYAGAAEAWWHLLGQHPFRPTPPKGSEGWALVPDVKQGWKTACKALRKLEPPGVLHPRCRYLPEVGYLVGNTKILMVSENHGAGFLVGKGCKQDVISIEGDKIQWVWVDEPPKRQHFAAVRARLVNRGPLWATLTPINRPVEWFRDMVDGNPEEGLEAHEPGWLSMQVALTPENAPHRSPLEIAERIAECLSHERAQRIEASWEGYTQGRWVPGFTDVNVVDDEHIQRMVSTVKVTAILSFDYGERPGATVGYLQAWTGSALYVLGEWVSDERMTPMEEVRSQNEKLLGAWGLSPFAIDHAKGDSNTAGKLGLGFTMNQLYEASWADVTKSAVPPFTFSPPRKGAGSVKARARMLSTACLSGKFFVHQECSRLRHSLRHYMGKNDDLKHPFDACGYGAEDFLAPHRGSGAGLVLMG